MGLTPVDVRAMSLADMEVCIRAYNRAHAPADGAGPAILDENERARLRAALRGAGNGAH